MLEPVAVAVPIVGAPGTIAATEAVEFELADTPLGAIELVAVTTQRIVLPTSAATNTYVLEVAPLMFVVTRCHWYVRIRVNWDPWVHTVANGERSELAYYNALHEHLSEYGHRISVLSIYRTK